MIEPQFRILQVSTVDNHGGAAKVAWGLHHAYREQGLDTWMAVGHKSSNDADVILVPNDNYRSRWWNTWFTIGNMLCPLVGKVPGAGIVRTQLHSVGRIRQVLETHRGHESFDFPGTWKLLDLPAKYPAYLSYSGVSPKLKSCNGIFSASVGILISLSFKSIYHLQ